MRVPLRSPLGASRRTSLTRPCPNPQQIQYQVDSTHSLSGNPSAIVPTLRAQHTSFMALASALASLDLQLKGLKEDYRVIWRDKTGKVGMDPFRAAAGRGGQEEVRRGMRGLEIR